ncbi:hypothetical protein [Amycolatopsis anabasis]|uniref:hypothetical protein n=1 Tax=Amycolatopsis anabasis TaxID=1840409 RepID=UPI001FEC59DE|nr:hypothetical protein [Amycolatopsis anabasis]
MKISLENGFQDQFQSGLHHTISDGRNAQPADFPRPTRLGNQPFPHRLRPKRTIFDRSANTAQKLRDTNLPLDPADGEAIRTGSSCPGIRRDPLPCNTQGCRVVHEVEQVIEPSARIGRRAG